MITIASTTSPSPSLLTVGSAAAFGPDPPRTLKVLSLAFVAFIAVSGGAL